MRILVIGIGKIGTALLKDLVRSDAVEEIVAADLNIKYLKRLAQDLGSEKVQTAQVDASDQGQLTDLMQDDFQCVASALLREFQFNATEAAIKSGLNYVDVGSPIEIFELNEAAEAAEVTVVPNCGLDPGIDRFCEGVAVSQLDKVETIHGFCGGFPQKGTPGYNNPLGYKASWSWFRAVGTYKGNATILKDGQRIEVPKLEDPDTLTFPEPIGEVEAFVSGASFDVLKHLNLTDVHELWNKTLRWPGHCQIWKALIGLHLTDLEPLPINLQIKPSGKSKVFTTPPEGGYVYNIKPFKPPVEISPFEFLNALGDKYLQYEKGEGDAVVLRTEVIGEKDGKPITIHHELVDFYDTELDITAMGRTTAYPTSIVAQMIARGEIKDRGVVHVSKIGRNPVTAGIFFNEMKKRGIHIQEAVNPS